MKLSIVIPMYNEEGIIQTLFQRLEHTKALFNRKFGMMSADIESIFSTLSANASIFSMVRWGQ
ncbi:MAG: hypothetical protein ACKO0Y_11755 [Bacteroidota bacterium]